MDMFGTPPDAAKDSPRMRVLRVYSSRNVRRDRPCSVSWILGTAGCCNEIAVTTLPNVSDAGDYSRHFARLAGCGIMFKASRQWPDGVLSLAAFASVRYIGCCALCSLD